MHNPLDPYLRDVGEVEEDIGERCEEEEDRGGECEEEGVEVGFARGWGGDGADGRKDEVLCFELACVRKIDTDRDATMAANAAIGAVLLQYILSGLNVLEGRA